MSPPGLPCLFDEASGDCTIRHPHDRCSALGKICVHFAALEISYCICHDIFVMRA